MKKTILFVLLDRFADWEAAFPAALEFARVCLTALEADTKEAIDAFYHFHKKGFCHA